MASRVQATPELGIMDVGINWFEKHPKWLYLLVETRCFGDGDFKYSFKKSANYRCDGAHLSSPNLGGGKQNE